MNLLHIFRAVMSKLKYVVVIFFILLINGVLDENSWLENYKRQVEIEQVERGIAYYTAQYDDFTRQYNALGQPQQLERVAREKYYMKRPGEDVFIIPGSDLDEEAPEEIDVDSITIESLLPW